MANAGLKGGTTRVQGVPAWFGLIRVSMLDAGLGGGGCTNAPLYGSAGTAILGCGVKEKYPPEPSTTWLSMSARSAWSGLEWCEGEERRDVPGRLEARLLSDGVAVFSSSSELCGAAIWGKSEFPPAAIVLERPWSRREAGRALCDPNADAGAECSSASPVAALRPRLSAVVAACVAGSTGRFGCQRTPELGREPRALLLPPVLGATAPPRYHALGCV
jgi:hypothetical protein